ncbi:MAG TPA: hypothetical protein PKZ92_02385 [Candidatus Woesebacteria bacterium]|jgi:hypothetical protein|nr:hypothetical protein [Candidatus Woesebacteria bacterium]
MKGIEKWSTIIFGLVLLVSTFIRFGQVKNYHTAFTYDQARDLLDIRALGEFKDLTVMGPTTSINGLRLGPFYYYFNLPAYWLGQGNPQALVIWNILGFLITGVIIFEFFRKKDVCLGLIVSSLFLMAPQLFGITQYFWNANMATYLSVYFYLALWNFLEKKDKKGVFWLGVTSGLLTQFEAAFGIVCILFAILVVVVNKKAAWWKNFLVGIVPWFLPQIALEIKNKFQMTKLLLGMFSGQNQVLGDKLPLGEIVVSHLNSMRKFMEGQFILPYGWGLIILLMSGCLILVNKKYRKFGIYFLSFWILMLGFYITIYHYPLKMWYLESLRVWYVFVVGMGIVSLSRYKKIIALMMAIFLIRNFGLVYQDQSKFMDRISSDDPKNLANLMKNIDWVYEKMAGDGFEAYSYVPEVYDYPNQYLYWWYGNKKYGYMPEKVSYSLMEVPEYLRSQNQFYKNARKNENGKIALIYEVKNDYLEWLNQFNDYCMTDKWETKWRTAIEIREKCR